MKVRYDGMCECGKTVAAGNEAGWDRTAKQVVCMGCVEPAPPSTPVDMGMPGASLKREYERRKASREARVRAKHPKLGGPLSEAARTWEASMGGHTRGKIVLTVD